MIEPGDILQKGSLFYRVYTTNESKNEIVMNKVIWNTIKEKLEIFHDYEYCKFDEVGKTYVFYSSEDPEVLKAFEILKRKTKLNKLNK